MFSNSFICIYSINLCKLGNLGLLLLLGSIYLINIIRVLIAFDSSRSWCMLGVLVLVELGFYLSYEYDAVPLWRLDSNDWIIVLELVSFI